MAFECVISPLVRASHPTNITVRDFYYEVVLPLFVVSSDRPTELKGFTMECLGDDGTDVTSVGGTIRFSVPEDFARTLRSKGLMCGETYAIHLFVM